MLHLMAKVTWSSQKVQRTKPDSLSSATSGASSGSVSLLIEACLSHRNYFASSSEAGARFVVAIARFGESFLGLGFLRFFAIADEPKYDSEGQGRPSQRCN